MTYAALILTDRDSASASSGFKLLRRGFTCWSRIMRGTKKGRPSGMDSLGRPHYKGKLKFNSHDRLNGRRPIINGVQNIEDAIAPAADAVDIV